MRSVAALELPFWFWILLGFCLARAALRWPAAGPETARARLPHQAPAVGAVAPGLLCPRELRTIPGVGQQRALAIARSRWEAERRGTRFELEEVPGIGPALARQISGGLALHTDRSRAP